MAEIVAGAVSGAVFEQLRREIGRVKLLATFKPKLEELEDTLVLLYPVIKEIEDLNRRLNGTDYVRETIALKKLLEDGTKLVSKCSKISRLNIFKQSRQREKLMELDNKIVKFIILMQPHMGRDQKQTLLIAKETKQMLNMSLNLHASNHQGYSNLTMDLTAASSPESSYKTVFHTVLQVKLAWQLHKIKAMKRLSNINGMKSIPGEMVRRMREKFVMNAPPARLERCQTQLRVTISKTFSTFTWMRTQDFVLKRLKSIPLRSMSYIVQKARKTTDKDKEGGATDKRETRRTETPRHGQKSKAASTSSSCSKYVPRKNPRRRQSSS